MGIYAGFDEILRDLANLFFRATNGSFAGRSVHRSTVAVGANVLLLEGRRPKEATRAGRRLEA